MSTPLLRVELTPEEDQTLQDLRAAIGVPQRTKDRAEALRLSHRGWSAQQIAKYLGWRVATARNAIHRWQRDGICGLWERTGIMTVVVQDNASIHTSKAVKQQVPRWQAQGLYLFQLPAYLNLIETEWHQLKAHEIRGAMFEDTYELAMGVIAGLNR